MISTKDKIREVGRAMVEAAVVNRMAQVGQTFEGVEVVSPLISVVKTFQEDRTQVQSSKIGLRFWQAQEAARQNKVSRKIIGSKLCQGILNTVIGISHLF